MSQRIGYAIVINTRGDIVGSYFQSFLTVAHSNTDPSLFDDGKVVASIAKSHSP